MNTPITILVVEDDAILRKLISSIFSKFASVVALEGGHQAIEYLKTNSVDMIFSDVCMPNGTGVELLDWMRVHLPQPPPVVLVTGQADITKEEAHAKGAYALVAKPFKVKDLTTVAHALIDLRANGASTRSA